jgi:hypothetical protein
MNPDSLAAAHRARGVVKNESQDGIWITEADHPILFERAKTLKPGDVTRVIDEDGFWTVAVFLEREAAKKVTFEEGRRTIQTSLRNLRADEILRQTLAELKAKYPVWMDEAFLSQAGGGD